MSSKEEPSFKRTQFLREFERIGPEKAAPLLVEQFLYCLRMDGYPPEDFERVFGVEMVEKYLPREVCDLRIGNLTYCVWKTLFTNKYITKDNLNHALWKHNLSQFFQEKVRQVYKDFIERNGLGADGSLMLMTEYVPELLKRGFDGIPWDVEVHQLLKKVSNGGFPDMPVSGIRVEGDQIRSELIHMDSTFEKCPIAAAAGIPLFVKKLDIPGKQLGVGRRYIISRMMSEPSTGIAPLHWAYGGALEPAPPVLVARKDAIPFTEDDWWVLDEFEMMMLDDGPRRVTRRDFVNFAKGYYSAQANLVLETKFPKGKLVRIVKLEKNISLNDRTGQVTGQYGNGRVRIKIDGLRDAVAVKPRNLTIIS